MQGKTNQFQSKASTKIQTDHQNKEKQPANTSHVKNRSIGSEIARSIQVNNKKQIRGNSTLANDQGSIRTESKQSNNCIDNPLENFKSKFINDYQRKLEREILDKRKRYLERLEKHKEKQMSVNKLMTEDSLRRKKILEQSVNISYHSVAVFPLSYSRNEILKQRKDYYEQKLESLKTKQKESKRNKTIDYNNIGKTKQNEVPTLRKNPPKSKITNDSKSIDNKNDNQKIKIALSKKIYKKIQPNQLEKKRK